MKNKLSDRFSKKIDDWTKKVSKIKIGMTYDEMIAVAGRPRITSKVSTEEQYVQGLDYLKYNYGKKWIYFKDKLVYRIKSN